MIKVYNFCGGRKMFVGYLAIVILLAAGFYMREENYRTFEAGMFAIYASLVLGNVGQKWIDAKNRRPLQTKITNEQTITTQTPLPNNEEYAN